MKKTVIALTVVLIVLVAILAALRVGIFAPTAQAPAPTDQALQLPPAGDVDATIESIDVGADLEGDFSDTDTDIQAL
jgi:hypothetical protein